MIVIAIVFHTYNNNTSRRNNFQWIMVSAFDILWYKRRLKNLGKMSKRNDSSNQFNENCYTNSHKTNWLLQHSTGHFCSTTLLYPWSKKYVKLLPLYFTSVIRKWTKNIKFDLYNCNSLFSWSYIWRLKINIVNLYLSQC